jgi:hypothetical protein
MAYTLDTTLGELLDHPQAKAVLDQQFPGVSSNPMLAMVRNMTLNALLAMPQAVQMGLTKERAEQFLVEVNKRVA